jgi:tight adherence protein C
MIVILLVGLALLALAVTLVARGASAGRARAVETLGQMQAYGYSTPVPQTAPKRGRLGEALDSLAAWLGESATAKVARLDERELRTELVSAGLYDVSPRKFSGYRILSTIAAPALWLWIGITGGLNPVLVFLGFFLCVAGGWQLPLTYVRTRARRRITQIEYELPELIDLLVVTVEAGVGFVASLQIASERIQGPLGDELRLVLQEQAMGLAVNEALRNMLVRCETPAVRSFVRSVLQGETLGVSIGTIMRNLAVEMRKRRKAHAEERAQKAPIKILFPLVFLIFPAMFVVLLAPAVISFLRSVGG